MLIKALKEKNIDTVNTSKIACIISNDEFKRLNYNATFDKSKYVAICIHDPDRKTHKENHLQDTSWPDYTSGFEDVLEIKFWDITISDSKNEIISDSEAKLIQDFIIKNTDKVFIIHCSAGISRSAGVGKAIECITNFGIGSEAKYQYLTSYSSDIDSHNRYSPNLTVFDKIVERH